MMVFMVFYHGGPPVFSRGDVIRPPDETGVETLYEIIRQYDPQLSRAMSRGLGNYRADRVYVARDDPGLAVIPAALWTLTPWRPGDGRVYAVRPEGQMDRDPDTHIGDAWMAERAVVERPAARCVTRAWALANVPGANRADWLLREVHRARENGEQIGPGSRLRSLYADKFLGPAAPPSPLLRAISPALVIAGMGGRRRA